MAEQKTFTRVQLLTLLLLWAVGAIWFVSIFRLQAPDTPRWAYCANNLKGLGEAMYIYAQDGDLFPMQAGIDTANSGRMRLFFPTDRGPFEPSTTGTPSPTVDLWLLLRANSATPKQFTCPYAPDLPDPAKDTTAYYDFLTAMHLSYAYQYQHDPDFSPLGTASQPLLPVLADANPYTKGGITASISQDRIGPGAGNSLNHPNREHQNVLFVDSHVSKVAEPAQGPAGPIDPSVFAKTSGSDNIYTTRDARGFGDPGIAPTATTCDLSDSRDTCFVP